MDINRIDHINFVAKDMDKINAAFEALTGKKPMFVDDHTSKDGVKESTFIFPHGFQVQQVTDASKPFGGWLEDMKDGVHTLTMVCENIKTAKPEMEALGFKVLREYVEPTQGLKYITFDTSSVFGFYVELMQYVDMYDYGYDGTDVIE